MLVDNEDDYSTIVPLNGKRRIVKAPGFVSHLVLLALVNVLAVVPAPIPLLLDGVWTALETASHLLVFVQATWYLFFGPNKSHAPRKRRSSGTRFRVPRMHILASTFGAVCVAEERRRALASGSSSASLEGMGMSEGEGAADKRVKQVKTPPDVLTPDRSPTMSPLAANVFTYTSASTALPLVAG